MLLHDRFLSCYSVPWLVHRKLALVHEWLRGHGPHGSLQSATFTRPSQRARGGARGSWGGGTTAPLLGKLSPPPFGEKK